MLLNAGRIAKEVASHADVVEIATISANLHVNGSLGENLSVWGGAVRILSPRAKTSDIKYRHPLLTVDPHSPESALKTENEIINIATRESTNMHGSDDEDLAFKLHETERKLAEARAAEKAAKSTLSKLRKEYNRLREQNEEEQGPVYSDPLTQFNYELHNAWLHMIPENERENTWPLRTWKVSNAFLESIDEQQVVDRARVVRACVDVLTGRHAESSSRASHKMNGDSGDVTREDGGKLWRCRIAQSPSAPRLHWWQLPDGAVELSYVGLHDDFRTV